MKEEFLIKAFQETKVIMKGHFLLTSGKHSDLFMQCSQLLQYPEKAEAVCQLMAEPFVCQGIDTVIGPAMGGIILSYEIARQLGARAVYTEQKEGRMLLRRGFCLSESEKVLVVEDAVTTGGSVRKVKALLDEAGAHTVGVSIMIDRSIQPLDFGAPLKSLLKIKVNSYSPDQCPLCAAKVPLIRPKG